MNKLTSFALTSAVAMMALSGCADQNKTDDASNQQQLTGNLSYLSRIALAPNSSAEVIVRDTSVANGTLVAKQDIELEGRQIPVPFNVLLNNQELSSATYSLTAVIKEQGQVSWRSAPIGVSGEPGLTDLGNVTLQQVDEYPLSSLMQCGEQRIYVSFDDEQAYLQLADQLLTLDQVMAASGARYQVAGDPSTELWNKGDKTQLTVQGEKYPECTSNTTAVLQGSAWQVINLNGENMQVPAGVEGAEASMHFDDDGRVYGRAFCNSFNGRYQLQDDLLSTSQFAGTMMLCSEQQMQHERTMLDVIGQAKRVEFNANGKLVIFAEDGRTLTAQ